MAGFFGFVDVGDFDEDGGFLDAAEGLVDGGAEDFHGGGEAHVGVDEGGDVFAELTDGTGEDFIVLVVGGAVEDGLEALVVELDVDGVDGADELVVVPEVFVEEVEEEVAGLDVEGGVHGDFAEEVLDGGVVDGEGAEAVPEVVEGEEGFAVEAGGLVHGLDEGAAELDHAGEVVAGEGRGEVEEFGGGEVGLAVGVEGEVVAEGVAVAAEDFLLVGVPDDELLVGVPGVDVPLVDVDFFAGAAAGGTEGEFAEAPDFTHEVGGVEGVEGVDFVVGLVGAADEFVVGEFGE